MKKLVFVATPHNGLIPYTYTVCIVRMWKDLFGKYDLGVSLADSALVHKNRNKLFSEAYVNKADYLLFVDTDIIWQTSDIEKLIEFDRDVVSGIYKSRRPLQDVENAPVVFRYDEGILKIVKSIPDNPFKVDGVGMGFCLIKGEVVNKMTELIPKIGYPFDYLNVKDIGAKDDGLSNTVGEDLSFCHRLQKAGYDIWVHPQVVVGHLTLERII